MTKGLWRRLIEQETELVKVAEGVDRTYLQVSSGPRGRKITTPLREKGLFEKGFFIEVVYAITRHELTLPHTARGHEVDVTDDDCLVIRDIVSSASNVCHDRTTYIPWGLISAITVHRDTWN